MVNPEHHRTFLVRMQEQPPQVGFGGSFSFPPETGRHGEVKSVRCYFPEQTEISPGGLSGGGVVGEEKAF